MPPQCPHARRRPPQHHSRPKNPSSRPILPLKICTLQHHGRFHQKTKPRELQRKRICRTDLKRLVFFLHRFLFGSFFSLLLQPVYFSLRYDRFHKLIDKSRDPCENRKKRLNRDIYNPEPEGSKQGNRYERLQICKEFPAKRDTKRTKEQSDIVEKAAVRASVRSLPPHKKDTDEDSDHCNFYKLTAGIHQSVLVLLPSLFLPALGLLPPFPSGLGGAGVAQAGRVLLGALFTEALSAFLAGSNSVSFHMIKAFHCINTPFNVLNPS